MKEEQYKFSSCMGCGYCCTKSPCVVFPMSSFAFDIDGSQIVNHLRWRGCPELTWDGTRHWCGIALLSDEKKREKVMCDLSIGAGCSSSLNSWRREPLQDRRIK